MPTPRKNQKQIAQKYAGNRRYFKTLNPFRGARIWAALVVVALAGIAAYFYLHRAQGSGRIEALDTTGPISEEHTSIAKNCQACHAPVKSVDPLHPIVGTAALDANCMVCHTHHTFHVADNDPADKPSCVDCHHEHLGTGRMAQVTDHNCQACHANQDIMAASSERGRKIFMEDPSAFDVVPKDTLLHYLDVPRPPQGYTQTFQSFEGEHPEFEVVSQRIKDPNTLRFNHQLHMTGDIPMVNGKKLDCDYCHKPDSRGAYMEPVSFAKNCQTCHSLQIDPTLADFTVPHPQAGGQSTSVRDFLLTLPTQYATYAMEKRKMTSGTEIKAFVDKQMLGIRDRVRRGDDLEADIFFAGPRVLHFGPPAADSPQERALFPGCVYCHNVTALSATTVNTVHAGGALPESSSTAVVPLIPVVTRPIIPDRFMVHAQFSHGAHTMLSCESCHGKKGAVTEGVGVAANATGVMESKDTSDTLMPDKASCVTCHSAKGGVVSTCATCHDYHNKQPASGVATATSLRAMMIGQP